MADENNSLSKNHFYAKYGNEEFSLRLCLYNSEGYITYLQRNSMVYLEIEDNIFNPFHSATLIIGNDQNVMEKTKNPYVFLGNGRDIIDIEIIPVHTGDFNNDIKDEGNKEFLSLKFNFVVIECVEIVYNNTVCKKLMLVEYAQYMLAENICNIFGLQKAGGVGNSYLDTNSGNAKPTGDVIKAIIYAVYNDGASSDDLFYKDNGNIVFESDGESVVNLNPYGVMSYLEVLNYVLSFHSYQDSPCVLQFDRYQKKFQLISLKTLCEKNAENTIECIRFPSTSQTDDDKQKQTQGPVINWNTYPITFEESKINQFYIQSPSCKYNVDMSGNSGILSTSKGSKSMIFNLSTLNSDSFMKKFYDLFVKPFKPIFDMSGYEAFPNFYPNPNKKNNYNSYKGVLPPMMDEKKFLNQKLTALLYLNNVYQFKLIGKTHRKSLAFIDVTKTAEYIDGKYKASASDRNVLGRHLITSVKHIFEYNTYKNEIETIKPYRLVDGNENGVTLSEFLTQNA
jgi:hypothetical protein